MIFVEKICHLKEKYSQSQSVQGYAELYNLYDSAPPLAEHIIYAPMSKNIAEHLITSYKLTIPKELLSVYQAMNGADLFWTAWEVPKTNIRIPVCCFSIYGIPIENSREYPEPFNISVEDLNRPSNTPSHWLKFGSYCQSDNISCKFDLFVDTELDTVHATEHNASKCTVLQDWNSIDHCLCSIFDMFDGHTV